MKDGHVRTNLAHRPDIACCWVGDSPRGELQRVRADPASCPAANSGRAQSACSVSSASDRFSAVRCLRAGARGEIAELLVGELDPRDEPDASELLLTSADW